MLNIFLACDANVERAGVCLFILQWVRGIRTAYADSKILVYFRKRVLNEELKAEFNSLGAEIITGELPENGTSLSSRNRNKVRMDVRKLFQDNKFDVVHVNSSAVGFSCVILSEAKRANIPVRISHSHGRNLGNGIKNIYLFFLKRWLKTLATKYAGCSVDAGIYLFGNSGVDSNKWMFVPNTINVETFTFSESERINRRSQIGIEDDTLVLGATGQLIVRKNHNYLLDVINELKKRNVNAKLIVLGEGDQRKTLEKRIKDLDLDNYVFLLGESNEIPKWLSSMDFYAMPSLTEGLPIGAVEAQANGLYCLLSDGVPLDVDLSADVYHLPIVGDTDKWADLIMKLPIKSKSQRIEGARTVIDAGFDTHKTPEYVRQLYEI